MIEYIGIGICVVFFLYFLWEVRKTKFTPKIMATIGLCSAVAYVLSLIQFIRMPQDGGISLVPMLPIMVISLIYGKGAGMTAGFVYSFLRLLMPPYIVSPVQFVLEYFVGNMVVGCAGMFGREKKSRIFLGCLVVTIIDFLIHYLVGVIYFGQFAGDMNIWWYSFIYNAPTEGLEGIITCIVVVILPLERIFKTIGLRKEIEV